MVCRDISELRSELLSLRAQVASLSKEGPVDNDALKNAIAKHNSSRAMWVERKRKCMEIVEMLADGLGKPVAAICVRILSLPPYCFPQWFAERLGTRDRRRRSVRHPQTHRRHHQVKQHNWLSKFPSHEITSLHRVVVSMASITTPPLLAPAPAGRALIARTALETPAPSI